jgi:hypothetical protein
MDGTTGFSSSNRSRNTLPQSSDCSFAGSTEEIKVTGGILTSVFGAVPACIGTTNSAIAKRRLPLDSAHQNGLETILIDFLILDWRVTTEGRSGAGGILKI